MILAIDPSLTCTGWALLRSVDDLVEFGILRLRSDDLPSRLIELATDIRSLVTARPDLQAIVIERPQTAGGPNRGGFAKMGAMTIAAYGAAFGAAFTTVEAARQPSTIVLTPQPSDWVGRGRIPSSAGDTYKRRRVQYVEQLYPSARGNMGAKTNAGNVADAILMGRWGAGVMKVASVMRSA